MCELCKAAASSWSGVWSGELQAPAGDKLAASVDILKQRKVKIIGLVTA